MTLVSRIIVRLSLILLPLIMLWAALFYFKMVDEINDETDDALEDYSELIIMRMLADRQLPDTNSGSNNNYNIRSVDSDYAARNAIIEYHDAEVYIPEKGESEPARVLKTIFRNERGEYFELTVSMPTFERDDLKETILWWMIYLYATLVTTIIIISIIVLRRSMRPLYTLLNWLDTYSPGAKNTTIPNDTRDIEFNKLNAAMQRAVNRTEEVYERQKEFIGNASHELQTPLAVMGNSVEWMMDQFGLNEEQMNEMLRLKETVRNAVKLNKNLLLLTKVDNRQFAESDDVVMSVLIKDIVDTLKDIYSYKEIETQMSLLDEITLRMNDSLARIMISNLLKNAFSYSDEHTVIKVEADRNMLSVTNRGGERLDGDLVFERFHQGTNRKGSAGLGLAIVKAIADYYNFRADYSFVDGCHRFSIYWR